MTRSDEDDCNSNPTGHYLENFELELAIDRVQRYDYVTHTKSYCNMPQSKIGLDTMSNLDTSLLLAIVIISSSLHSNRLL
jgi:hypothetical protein